MLRPSESSGLYEFYMILKGPQRDILDTVRHKLSFSETLSQTHSLPPCISFCVTIQHIVIAVLGMHCTARMLQACDKQQVYQILQYISSNESHWLQTQNATTSHEVSQEDSFPAIFVFFNHFSLNLIVIYALVYTNILDTRIKQLLSSANKTHFVLSADVLEHMMSIGH